MTPIKRKYVLMAAAGTLTMGITAIPFVAAADPSFDLPADHEQFVHKVVDLTNQQRAAHGCDAVTWNDALFEPAQYHSNDMADNDFMDHTGSDGRGPDARVGDSDYEGRYGAENVAAGYRSPSEVVDGWMDSEGHRANILNCELNDIAVGYSTNSDSTYHSYWTQLFGVA